MGDHGLDLGIVGIRRRLGRSQNQLVIENIQALVFHGAHVEIGHRNDIENVEIIFAQKYLFIPDHRALQRIHGIASARLASVLDINPQRDFPAGHRGKISMDGSQISPDESKEITRLGVRIFPDGEMPVGARNIAFGGAIAIAEQHRRFGFVRLQAQLVARKHIGPVQKIGNAPETFCFALRAIGRAGAE